MNRDYNDCKDYEGYVAPSEQAIAVPRCKIKGYLHHFFPYIDLSFLLKKIDAIEEGEFTLRIVGDKLQLIDGEGQVVSEVTLSEGQQGPPGITPNVSAAAFVNDGTGTPSVEVVKSGTTENPTFSFNFSNLKGATGATGPASTVPGPAGTPFQVKAQYDTYAEMIAAHPTGQVGDAYQVGENASLATVATTGDYNDLINKPTIPTVNNSTITISQGGVTKGSFTLNQASNATIDVDAGGGGGGDDYTYSYVGICTASSSPVVANVSSINISVSIMLQNHVDHGGGYTDWVNDWNTQVNVNQSYNDKASIVAALGQNLATWPTPQPTNPSATEARWVLRQANVVFGYDNDTFIGYDNPTHLVKDATIIPIIDNMIPNKVPGILSSNGDFISGLPWTVYKVSSQNQIVLELGYWKFVLPNEGGIFVPNQYDNIPIISN